MKSFLSVALIATPLAFSLITPVQAQEPDSPKQKPFSVQIGPIDRHFLVGNAQDLFSTGLHLGASYALPIKGLEASGASTAIDFDYNHNGGSGGYLDSYGVSLVGRVPLTSHNTKDSVVPYAGLGIGYWETRVKYTTSITTTTPVMPPTMPPTTMTTTAYFDHSGSGSSIGGKFLLGLSFQAGYFTEFSYFVSKQQAGVSPSSFNLSFGLHF